MQNCHKAPIVNTAPLENIAYPESWNISSPIYPNKALKMKLYNQIWDDKNMQNIDNMTSTLRFSLKILSEKMPKHDMSIKIISVTWNVRDINESTDAITYFLLRK